MSDKLLPCPNPECANGACNVIGCEQPDAYWVSCSCGMCGPTARERAEARRLWNLLPRSTPAVPGVVREALNAAHECLPMRSDGIEQDADRLVVAALAALDGEGEEDD